MSDICARMRTDYKGRLEVLSVVFGWVSVVRSIRLYERYQIVHDRRVEKSNKTKEAKQLNRK